MGTVAFNVTLITSLPCWCNRGKVQASHKKYLRGLTNISAGYIWVSVKNLFAGSAWALLLVLHFLLLFSFRLVDCCA